MDEGGLYYRSTILEDSTVEVESFAGFLEQSYNGDYLYLPVRQENLLYRIKVDHQASPHLICNSDSKDKKCQKPVSEKVTPYSRRLFLNEGEEDVEQIGFVDPIGVKVGCLDGRTSKLTPQGYQYECNGGDSQEYIFISGLLANRVLGINSQKFLQPGEMLYLNLFSSLGANNLEVDAQGNLYVASRFYNYLLMFDLKSSFLQRPPMGDIIEIAYGYNQNTSFRDIIIHPDGRLFAVSSFPDALMAVKIPFQPEQTGADKRYQVLGAVALNGEPSQLALYLRQEKQGANDLLYVSVFRQDQVLVIDANTYQVVNIIEEVGDGPFDLTVDYQHKKLYVSNFEDSTISIIDISPKSGAEHKLVAKISN